mmetsp:Transcript_2710/g.8015  ORF Transcript_2710/g.8015 Transcript_2710/m.8015 type:complete len:447 (+) Transcript_2710:188-1528(+)|eukprot:CAMPEP_0206135456 /NCGR_PEP_ID=MMETSP1473-20131121/736_1 /ASSEMBLY_ACC=CAM_ASM_001109 /TAXON_ID=1461547 /ORGANISM="Stichococcus sp, Strain RCC1054" /LENGTH=446 /DNA_ID=CAMNT_0053527329 /DNA_START=179 /DNA_END=1519 /DNA_ORIENTATION=+
MDQLQQLQTQLNSLVKPEDKKPKKKLDPARVLADELRGKRGVESRIGVLAGAPGVDADRVEYFRGKDFAAWLREHPDKIIPGTCAAGATQEQEIQGMMQLLQRKKLVRRTERLYKKPKPGRKRLTKWPRKLEHVPENEQGSWSEDYFYYFAYEQPSSPWVMVGALALAIGVVLLCLFPLAPYKIKIAVVYISVTLLGVLFGLILLRAVVAGITWAAAGRCIWLLPNMLSETVGIDEAFWPLWELEEVDESWRWYSSHVAYRAAFALTTGVTLYGLAQVGPGTGELTAGAKATHDQILEWFNLQESQFQRLGNGTGNGTSVTSSDDRPGATMQQNPMTNTDQRSAQGIAQMAKMRAAAEAAAAAANPPLDEVLPTFEEILEEEAAEAAAEAGAAARAAGATEQEISDAQEFAAAAVRNRATDRDTDKAETEEPQEGEGHTQVPREEL